MTAMDRRPADKELQDMLTGSGLFSGLDIHFACFLARLAKADSPAIALAAALVSRETAAGNICLNLAEFAGKILHMESGRGNLPRLTCPGLEVWSEQLLKSGVAGDGRASTPLVLDSGNRLYLRRYWDYENTIAGFVRQRTAAAVQGINKTRLAADLTQLFRPLPDGRTDWQKVAALMAVTRSLSVISGGPGTGKTTTVAKILLMLHRHYEGREKPRIALAAPTGKAAARLQETLIASDFLPEKIIMEPATTLHRLLGPIADSPYFRHNRENPLSADVIIIDEASMVDLPLMAKLMGAVPESARLILLGDRHQLASVQPGSVLGDICPPEGMHEFSPNFCRQASKICGATLATGPQGALRAEHAERLDSFVELTDNYRFPADSAIARLSRAVKEGDADRAVDLLTADRNSLVTWADIPAPEALAAKLRGWEGFAGYAAMGHAETPDACLALLERFRILCGLRRGPYGMQRINGLLAQQLAAGMAWEPHGKYPPAAHLPSFIPGQPVMVTSNDYNLGLFNGDVGIIAPDPGNKKAPRVYFKMENGRTRDIGFSMLPEHETVYAMTVHKSQGSEFSHVLLILPEQDSPLLTRELLYTAMTRAKEKLEVWGRKEIFHAAVKRRIQRASGLADKIWGEVKG